jgi:predicted DsbA family dithiol-disulfide isomerase
LHPDTPEEGTLLDDLFRGRGFDREVANRRMKSLMNAEGLPYGDRERTFNSRLAQELGKFAEQKEHPEIHNALYRAYFVEGRNLAKREVLVDVATSVGISADEARAVLADRTMRAAVDADWARSRELGVTGVPTFVIGNRGLVGAQPYEALEEFALSSGAERREGEANLHPVDS